METYKYPDCLDTPNIFLTRVMTEYPKDNIGKLKISLEYEGGDTGNKFDLDLFNKTAITLINKLFSQMEIKK